MDQVYNPEGSPSDWSPPGRSPTRGEIRSLVDKARKHDSEAFGKLYDIFFGKIYNYVYYKVGDTTEAEDLTEQVFMKALEAIDKFEWKGVPFSSWLFRIASNVVIDYYRTRSRVTMVPVEDFTVEVGETESSEEAAIKRFTQEKLYIAISRLTGEQQQVIILKFLTNLSNVEIANTLGKTEGAVKALQHRALRALHKILKGAGDEGQEG